MLSEVVLSFGIPFAFVPLVVLTGRRDLVGVHVNRPMVNVLVRGVAAVITLMNLNLILTQLL